MLPISVGEPEPQRRYRALWLILACFSQRGNFSGRVDVLRRVDVLWTEVSNAVRSKCPAVGAMRSYPFRLPAVVGQGSTSRGHGLGRPLSRHGWTDPLGQNWGPSESQTVMMSSANYGGDGATVDAADRYVGERRRSSEA